jgi:glycerol-3-phosphate dehydrogenase
MIADLPAEEQPLAAAPDYTAEEIAWLVDHELAAHLDDLVLRRTSLAFTGKVTVPLLRELAIVAGASLGWDAEAQEQEVTRAIDLLNDRHGLGLEAASSAAR